MAFSTLSDRSSGSRGDLSVLRLLVSGAVSAGLIFVLCWIGMFVPFSSPTHGLIPLFTSADPRSTAALVEGGLWALLFGGLAASVFGLCYNLTTSIDRRS